jgi:ubiquinone/menaquinone biosynthesis C-methylase UbiE
LRNPDFSVADVNHLELPAESFDVAHFSGVLAYLKEPERALKLAFRSLKSGAPGVTPDRRLDARQ